MRCDSPLGRLLFAQDVDGNVAGRGRAGPREDDALARFRKICPARSPRRLRSSRPARDSPPVGARRSTPSAVLERRACWERRLDTAWRRTSYSALDRGRPRRRSSPCRTRAGGRHRRTRGVAAAPVASELPLSVMASGPQLGTLDPSVHSRNSTSAPPRVTGALREVAQSRRRPAGRSCSAALPEVREGAFTCARHPAWWRAW